MIPQKKVIQKWRVMPTTDSKTASISLDKDFVEFLKKYIKEHRIELLQAGKADSIVSIIRQGLFYWAEKEGLLEEFQKYLKQRE